MADPRIGRLALVLVSLVGLSACENGGLPFGGGGTGEAGGSETAAESTSTVSLVARDVEAREVFDLTDEGLWDGRPSLGGVWVAHASVKDPERVMIRNTANGKSVIGALFRRELANPGPSLQVSSDAASALEMLAGQPVKIEVVALRREEPAAPEAQAAAAEIVAEGEDTAAQTSAAAAAPSPEPPPVAKPSADTDITMTAAAAIDRAEGITGPAETGAEAASANATAASPEAPRCPFWRKKKCLAEQAAAAGATAGTDGTADETDGAETGAAASVTSQPLAVPASTAAAGTLTRPFVQIGIFSVEANAQRASDQMRAAGMTALVKADESQGKKFWRVIVGPASSVSERDALAAKVKGVGYPDAYPVSQ